MLSVQLSSGVEAIQALTDEWTALAGDSFTSAFAQPGWHLAAIDAFPRRKITVITAREGDRLVGVLPLCRIPTDARGLYFNLVGPPGRGDYQAFVLDPPAAPQALPAMLEAALCHYGRHGVYWFPNLPAQDASLDVLRDFLKSHRLPSMEDRESAPRLRIDGADFAALERTWPSSHRKDVRRQRKRLAEKGPVELWQPSTLEEALPVLEEFFKVHDAKWLSQGFPGMFHDPAQRNHFKAILRHLWNRGAHFSTIRCGDTDVSYHFGFFSGGWIQWYRPSYRHEFGGYSPSKIHIAMLIERACERGWQGFDFLLGAEGYKTLWCNEETGIVNLHAGFHRWAPSYFWFSRGKPFVRGKLQAHYFRARAWMQGARKGSPE